VIALCLLTESKKASTFSDDCLIDRGYARYILLEFQKKCNIRARRPSHDFSMEDVLDNSLRVSLMFL
jgi:hypothetical protein